MKKSILITVLVLVLGAIPVYAHTTSSSHNHENEGKPLDEVVLGAKADAPNLIRLSENWTIGVEGAKDLRQTSLDEGWEVYGKMTYTGSILNFSAE